VWMVTMIAASACETGFFTFFYTNQTQMNLGIPWLFPFQITVGAISLVFLMVMTWLISQNQLLPGVVLIGSFMLFVLWTAGLVQLGIMLFGTGNSVNANCNGYINDQPFTGVSVGTLAWIAEKNMCNCWDAGFAFQFIAVLFLIWMMVMAYQVHFDNYD